MTNLKQFTKNLLEKYDFTSLLVELRSFFINNVTETGEIVLDDVIHSGVCETAASRTQCKNCNAIIDDPSLDTDTDTDDDDDNCLCVDKDKLSISKWTIIKFVTEAVLIVRCWVWGLCDKPWYILWKKNDKTM